jgi:molybdenum storage protein
MGLVRTEGDGRLHIRSDLMGESLTDKSLMASTTIDVPFRIMPDVHVVKIGGQSILDRGRVAVFPILDEIVQNRRDKKIILSTGGGTRSRHVYSIALDLGMPTGVLARLGESISEQNALMVAMLLANRGGVKIGHEDISKLASYLNLGCIPIVHGMPPYGLWEEPPALGRIPSHRTDVGAFLLAEVLGCDHCVFIKDEQGLFNQDPKKNPAVELIPEIEINELIRMDLDDLVVERAVLQVMKNALHVKKIFIVNGLVPGNITRALNGDNAGTVIYRK